VVFEPTISAGERPQTYGLDRAATGTGSLPLLFKQILQCSRICNNYLPNPFSYFIALWFLK
jgi:hypothetical protein